VFYAKGRFANLMNPHMRVTTPRTRRDRVGIGYARRRRTAQRGRTGIAAVAGISPLNILPVMPVSHK
jgi:hypothetical protein